MATTYPHVKRVRNHRLKVTVPHLPHFLAFDLQVKQYAETGVPGITHHREAWNDAVIGPTHINCVLYRDADGKAIGILNHYPTDMYENDGLRLERKGNVNVFVSPDHLHHGIGLALISAADRLFIIDFDKQHYTPAGAALVASYLRRKKRSNQ